MPSMGRRVLTDTMLIAKISAKGSFHLFWGLTLSTLISAVGTVVLINLLQPSDYGLYSIAFYPSSLMILFVDLGINSAMIKYVAQYRKGGETGKIRNILASGLIFKSILSMALSLLTFLLAGFFATTMFHRPEMEPLIRITSITVLSGTMLTTAQSAIIGYERMELKSLTMIIQKGVKGFLPPLLIVLGWGVLGGVLGYTISFVVAGLVGVLICFVAFYRHMKIPGNYCMRESLMIMWKYGFPISVSSILGNLLVQFYNFMMPIFCNNELIGNYQAAGLFGVLITFFTTPIYTALFPAFSKIDSKKEGKTLKTVFQFSVKYAALITVPATSAIIVLSDPLIAALFGSKYSDAPFFLALNSIGFLFVALGNLSVGNLINGQGETRMTLKLSLVTLAFGLSLAFVLVPLFGIIGVITGNLVAGIPSLFLALWWIKKHYGAKVDLLSSTKILGSSATAGFVTYTSLLYLPISSEWAKLFIGAIIFFMTYVLVALLTKTIDASDICNLRQMASQLGLISKMVNVILDAMERILQVA